MKLVARMLVVCLLSLCLTAPALADGGCAACQQCQGCSAGACGDGCEGACGVFGGRVRRGGRRLGRGLVRVVTFPARAVRSVGGGCGGGCSSCGS